MVDYITGQQVANNRYMLVYLLIFWIMASKIFTPMIKFLCLLGRKWKLFRSFSKCSQGLGALCLGFFSMEAILSPLLISNQELHLSTTANFSGPPSPYPTPGNNTTHKSPQISSNVGTT